MFLGVPARRTARGRLWPRLHSVHQTHVLGDPTAEQDSPHQRLPSRALPHRRRGRPGLPALSTALPADH
eukprot:6512007-Prymnesium_polylepis.1